MNLNEIKELLEIIDQTNLTHVKFEDNNFKLEVSKINDEIFKVSNSKEVTNKKEAINKQINYIDENILENELFSDVNSNEKINIKEIVAPLMGTFYSSPGPNDNSFVKIGDLVKRGDTLCILEAMKLMNEINSDIDGEVVQILVENEDLVEYNQPLFKIRPL